MTGGGSGGHITPVLAVARALKRKQPDVKIVYVAKKGDKLSDDVVVHDKNIDEVKFISGGKWRRYHGEGWRQLFDIATLAKNVRDFFRLLIGTLQSLHLLHRLKPDGVFIKGAYVGVPIGWAARFYHIPYVTLDLDALPSLANRLIAKHAAAHAVGMPKGLYSYPQNKTFFVGVPIREDFSLVTPEQRVSFRTELGLSSYDQVILATGGGLGAVRLNQAIAEQMPQLLKLYPRLALIHIVGHDHEQVMQKTYQTLLNQSQLSHIIVKGFINDVYRFSGAADVIISRAGATSLAEFSAQAKACIIVPNPLLTGGHQLKNAEQLAAHGAIKVVNEADIEEDSNVLLSAIKELLESSERRVALGRALHAFAPPDAAENVADLLIKTFNRSA